MPAVFGLIDANSFYCSCERAFSPRLRGRAVIVLSNNDGCAIARSSEAKAAGIRMGDPWHLVKDKPSVRAAKVEWFSSNYSLYGDMSRRMYQVLADRVPRVEPYSIDEMFLDLDVPGCPAELSRKLRDDVRRIAKLPTCVGIGPTKTVAKLANAVAKDNPSYEGVCDLRSPADRAALYRKMPIGEVWGIGGRTTAKLERVGVKTVEDFVLLPPREARDMLTVVGARVQQELRGQSCLALSEMAPSRKGLAVTRAFGKPVTRWGDMREACAAHAARAGEKLRAEGMVAGHMQVFLHTNPHNGDPWYTGSRAARIEATDDSGALIATALRMLTPLWRDGYRYAKVGIMLNDLRPRDEMAPGGLFPSKDPTKSAKAMAAMDLLNARFGRGTVRPLATGIRREWATKARRLSPHYTTRIEESMFARAW